MTLAAIMTIISIYAQQSRAMIVKLPLGGTYVGRSAADIDSYVSATEEPYLSLNYHSFSFKEPRGGPVSDSKFLKLTNAGPGRFRWEITYDCPWLELSRLSGDVGSELQFVAISVNPSGMEVGVYTCALTISGEGAVNSPQTVTVSLTIVGPRIALSRRTIGFDVLEGRAGPD
ncbi:MAG: hypothetical protein KAR47_15315, partial [Planctomycetes bacterium]|nr:hypothetical protein [Planctomycetota bacterium]